MNDRTLRLLSAEEVKQLYTDHMKRDFPADELKPLATLLGLTEKGCYQSYGLFDQNGLMAYALYWSCPGDAYVMLDYFAVLPQYRNGGVGSEMLREMLERFCQNGGGVFGEVEVPNTGDEAVDALRRRRLGFYGRAGMRIMGFQTKVFGVPYHVIAYGPEISDEDLMEVDRRLYRSAFPDQKVYDKHIFIPYDPEAK